MIILKKKTVQNSRREGETEKLRKVEQFKKNTRLFFLLCRTHIEHRLSLYTYSLMPDPNVEIRDFFRQDFHSLVCHCRVKESARKINWKNVCWHKSGPSK